MPGEHYDVYSVDERLHNEIIDFYKLQEQQNNLILQTSNGITFGSCPQTGITTSASLDHVRIPIIPENYPRKLNIRNIRNQLLNMINGETQGDIN